MNEIIRFVLWLNSAAVASIAKYQARWKPGSQSDQIKSRPTNVLQLETQKTHMRIVKMRNRWVIYIHFHRQCNWLLIRFPLLMLCLPLLHSLFRQNTGSPALDAHLSNKLAKKTVTVFECSVIDSRKWIEVFVIWLIYYYLISSLLFAFKITLTSLDIPNNAYNMYLSEHFRRLSKQLE